MPKNELLRQNHSYLVLQQLVLHLLNLVEEGNTHSRQAIRTVKKSLSSKRLGDVLVLGCTHYIFLKDTIGRCIGRSAYIIEPSSAVAQRVRQLRETPELPSQKAKGKHAFFTSASPTHFKSSAEKLLKRSIDPINKVEILRHSRGLQKIFKESGR